MTALTEVTPETILTAGKWLIYYTTGSFSERLITLRIKKDTTVKELNICASCTINGAQKIS